MFSKRHLLFIWVFLLAGAVTLFAQDEKKDDSGSGESKEGTTEDSGSDDGDGYPYPSFRSEDYKQYVPKSRQDQQDKFMDNKYNFPARPRDKWEIGLNGGLMMISGDVKAKPGWGVGLHVRKSLGYLFSLRLAGMFGSTKGQNWQPTDGWDAYNQALMGNTVYDKYNADFGRTPDYRTNNAERDDLVFYNYKTDIRDIALSGILTIHNIRFHKRETCIELYGLAGIGGVAYRAMMDQLDADGNLYDYAGLVNSNAPDFYTYYENRGASLDQLKDLYDGTYESQAERHFDDWTPFENFSFKPTAHVGVGLAFKLGRVVNLALETKVTYTNDDLLDGQRWQEWEALTRDYDTYIYTGANLNFNIGGKNSVEPLWWMNPLDYSYQELNEKPCCEDMPAPPDLGDKDKDGVPNAWDEEPESREGCPVDTHGKMLDSDRDGVLDCDDKEPHSPYDKIGRVDKYGVAPVDPLKLSCKDMPDICDCAKKCMPAPVMTHNPCANPVFPTILFDLDKYSVKAEFESQLAEVARILRDCPGTAVCVIGHTDVRHADSYNNVLSYKRAQEVVNALVNKYGVSRSQVVLQYRGEHENAVSGLSDSGARKGIDADHALNRRVEFRVCPPGGDMGKPKGPNAGKRQP
jgi:OOP family OmpA-OmpF porin